MESYGHIKRMNLFNQDNMEMGNIKMKCIDYIKMAQGVLIPSFLLCENISQRNLLIINISKVSRESMGYPKEERYGLIKARKN